MSKYAAAVAAGLSLFLLTLVGSGAFGRQPKKAPARKPGTYAVLDTSMGTIVCELYPDLAPQAVANFIGLAEGTKEWLSLKGDFQKRPFYNGLTFHRVLKNYLIQTGDITGSGGNFQAVLPFDNEIVPSLKFDRPGVMAMANNGPRTNFTQFFITVVPAPPLDGKYTIFGGVVDGLAVVKNISNVPASESRPIKNIVIIRVTVERIGK